MPPRILIVRFSAIGDCVMAAWAVTAIRQKFPDAHIVWAAETRCLPVIDTQRLVNETYEIRRKAWKQRPGPSKLVDQVRTYLGLRDQKFDWGFDLQGHTKTAVLLRLAQPKNRLAARATDALAARLNPILPGYDQNGHTVERNLRVVSALGDLELPESPLMPDVQRPGALPVSSRLATIMTGAGHPSKVVPTEHWIQVAQGLLREGWEVAFLGGPNDPRVILSGTTDLVGNLSLAETMGAVRHSQVHLAGDTGTGHIAAAYRVPLVSIFGPTDPAVFRPYAPTTTVLSAGSTPAEVGAERILSTVRKLGG